MKTKNNTHFTKLLLLIGLLVLAGNKGWGQASIAAIGTAVTQNFNTLTTAGTWTDNTTLSGWYAKTDATASITQFYKGTGSTITTAGLYSFSGTSGNTDRALGYIPSDAFTGTTGVGNGYLGWRLKNNTGVSIGTIRVVWTGEQYRKAIDANVQYIKLSYQVGTTVTDLISGTYILTNSQFASPIHDATAASTLDGNLGANRVTGISIDINVVIPAGSEVMLRWEDLNDPANHILSIDDVSFTATKQSQTITFNTLADKTYGDADFSLAATASSGLAVSYTSSNTSVATISGSTVTITGAGTTSFTASQSGNGIYSPATDVVRVLNVKPQAPTASAASGVTPVDFVANWTTASGAAGYYLYYGTDPSLVNYTAASVGNVTTFDLTGLNPNTTYYYRLKAINTGIYSDYSNIISVKTGIGIQTHSITATPSFTGVTLNWTNGNLSNRIVFVQEGTDANSGPEDGITYTARTDWNNVVDELGNGYYCVYHGTGTTVSLTNLYPGYTYTVQAFEYNGSTGNEIYLKSVTGASNPITFTTWGTTTFTNTTPGQSTPEDWTTAARWDHATVPTAALHSAVLVYIDGNCEITTTAASNNLTIKSAHSNIAPKLTINPAKSLTVSGTLTNNAGTSGLVIKSTATGTGQLMHNNAGVLATVERYVTGLHDGVMGRYHLLSVPINTVATPLLSEVYLWSYLARYDEANNGWHQMNTPTDNSIYTGLGYLTYDPTDAEETYYYRGELNYANVAAQVNYTGATRGWNLVGNPYPSTLDWNAVSGKTNIDASIYVWDQVNRVYKSYNGTIPAGGNYIAPGQALLVKANGANPALTFNNTARTLQAATFYKSTEATPDVLHLVAKINKLTDESYLHFNPASTELFDGSSDAYKLTSMAGKAVPNVYTLDAGGTKYSINNFPYDGKDKTIDLGFLFGTDGVATFSFDGIETFSSYPQLGIYLTDTKTGADISLKVTPEYTFNYVASDDPKRFKIRFAESLTGLAEKKAKALKCYVYTADKNLTIQYNELQSKKGYAYILDAQGRTVKTVLLDGSGSQQIQLPVASGVYLVKLLFSDFTETHKIAIR